VKNAIFYSAGGNIDQSDFCGGDLTVSIESFLKETKLQTVYLAWPHLYKKQMDEYIYSCPYIFLYA
jgi:hypothetical protein